MTTPDEPTGPPAGANGGGPAASDAERIVADIEATRAELGETVDELAARLDLRAQARQQVAGARERAVQRVADVRRAATDDRGRPTPAALGAAGGAAALLAGLVFVTVRRRSGR